MKKHYCGGCKRMIPHAPGLRPIEASTIGVAHVVVEPMCVGTPCRPQRYYQPDEQHNNLALIDLDG